jgi:hypothetical protein
MATTIERIKKAIAGKRLSQPFAASDVNSELGIDWAGTFLPKHRKGNPGGYREFFERIPNTRGGRYKVI